MYNFEKFMSEVVPSRAILTIAQSIKELKVNMLEYGGRCIVETLIGSGAGQYAGKQFLELVGVPEDEFNKAYENNYEHELINESLEKLAEDISTMCEEHGFDLGEFAILVDYNENDGGIDLMVQYHEYQDICDLDEEEYSKRLALAEHFECGIGEVIDIDEDKYQVAGIEYLVVDDSTADSYCRDYIEDSLWAFNSSFLGWETGLSQEIFIAIKDKYDADDEGGYIKELIDATCGLDRIVSSAISEDGRGHYLSSYDGDEIEIDTNDETLYAYRL